MASSAGGRMTWIAEWTSAGWKPASVEARHPDRHVAAVDQDHDGVRQDADEGEAQARVARGWPTGRRAGSRTRRRAAGRAASRRCRRRPSSAASVPNRTITASDRAARSSGAGRRRGSQRAAGEQAEDRPSDDAADQHRGVRHASRGITREASRESTRTGRGGRGRCGGRRPASERVRPRSTGAAAFGRVEPPTIRSRGLAR